MCKHSLISLALISFSIVSNAAAIPMDANQAAPVAIQNAVLHKDVALVQGGYVDKDVAGVPSVAVTNKCPGDLVCNKDDSQYVVIGDTHIYMHQSFNDWFVQGSSGALQSLMVWLILLSSVVFFLSRKSASTK
jgi:hypothetical protein